MTRGSGRSATGMLYKFKSKASGDVIMLEPHGDQVLHLIGKEPAAKGIIEPAAMAAAIQAIEQAIAADEAARRADADEGSGPRRDKVSLRQRAWPLLEMLKRARLADQAIVWGV